MFRKTSPLVIITVILGLIYGCGSSNPYIDDAQSSIKENNPAGALDAAEQSIENHPSDPLGYYYKAVALGGIADNKEPSEREQYYKDMISHFNSARQVADTTEGEKPKELENIPVVITQLWGKEFNQAVAYVNNDSLNKATEEPLKKAISHLQNATVIQPDSANTWSALAQISFRDKNLELAIESMSKAIDLMENPEPQDYVNLAAYYANAQKMEGAIKTLQEAREEFPQNNDIIQRLADAYQKTGQAQKAISTVEYLVEQDPENPQYHLALGTQIYQTAITINDEIIANYDKIFMLEDSLRQASGSEEENIQQRIDNLVQENEEKQKRYNELSERAEKHLNTVLEYRPNSAVAYNTLGIIYQNKAAAIFEERNRTEDNEMAAQLDKRAKDALRKAMGYYEKAAEIEPDNKEYWKSLFSIYTTLGMDEKADEAMKKAGMQ